MLAGLGLALGLITATTWRKWGWPTFDGGYDPTVADVLAHGGKLYDDVRYFYGPAGVYSLALAFKVLGTSLSVAFVFGYVQALAILGGFYVLARQWLAPLAAGLATLVLLVIAFSGTFFDFVLPHTDAATFGALFLILQVLALARGRLLLGGVALGILLLTRPEYWPVGAAAVAGAALGRARDDGWRAGARLLIPTVAPALVIAAATVVYFASPRGLNDLLFEQIVPLDFIRAVGGRLQGGWAPFDVESLVATIARAIVLGALVVGALASAAGVARHRGPRRALALWPLACALVALALVGAAWHVLGIFPGTRRLLEDEIARLLIAMSWLPVVAVLAALLAARRALGRAPPLGPSWTADLTLAAASAACGLRAYNRFDFDSYAPYFAALPVLVTAVLLEQTGMRWPSARLAARGVLVVMAVALALHAYAGPYRHDTQNVETPRGSFMAYREGGQAIQGTVDYLRAHAPSRAPIAVFPDSPGLHFLSDHPPALRDVTFLPATLDSTADERAAIRQLEHTRPPLIVVGAQRTQQYGQSQVGVDYDRVLFGYLNARYRPVASFGDVRHPTRDNLPPHAFTILGTR